MKLFIKNVTAEVDFLSLPFSPEDMKKATARLTITIDGEETTVDLLPGSWAMFRRARHIEGTIDLHGSSEVT